MKFNSTEHFAEGIRLFNQGNFFEAHEVWEEIWKRTAAGEKILYQGIIQAAAALVHVRRGNYKGAVSLYVKSRDKLDQLPAVWMGIDAEQFRRDLARYFEALRMSATPGREDSSPARGPIAATRCPPTIMWAAR